MSQEQITRLVRELEQFHRDNPLSAAFEALYRKTPVELMVRTFLASVFDPAETEYSAEKLAREALEAELPYTVLLGDVNFLQESVVRLSDRESDDPVAAFLEISRAFSATRNEVARVYLNHAVEQNGLLRHSGDLRRNLLLRIYDNWFSRLRQAVKAVDLSAVKDLAADHRHFTCALHYPESQMVCMDAHSCALLEQYHRSIQKQTLLLYYKLLEEAFEEAYLLYNELTAQVKRLAALLTTLYFNYETNRLGIFFRFIRQQAEQGERMFLGMVNLRGLNRVNQLEGEQEGDRRLEVVEKVLLQLAEKHRNWVSTVRGLAGDFYLIMQNHEPAKVRAFLQQISEQVEPYHAEVQCAAVYLPLIDLVEEDGLRRIMSFLHEQKSEAVGIYADSASVKPINQWVRARLDEALDIDLLLRERRVEVYLQPICRRDNSIQAFEVLGRLVTDERVVSAGLFIDRLLQLGLMEQFDIVMLEAVAAHAEALERTTDELFVNVSAVTLASEAYLARLNEIRTGSLHNLNLVLEITEQALLDNVERIRCLHEEHGLVFAVDDFGSGYSSLSTVIELAEMGAIAWLKIDGSLVQRLDSGVDGAERVIQVIQQMATALKLKTVAEHIENEKVLNRLRMLGIDAGQGYWLGKPDTVRKWEIHQQLTGNGG